MYMLYPALLENNAMSLSDEMGFTSSDAKDSTTRKASDQCSPINNMRWEGCARSILPRIPLWALTVAATSIAVCQNVLNVF